MDEIAEAIGSLRAGFDAIARRQDAMQLERASQHTEAISRITDVQAQIHEIKHAQNNDAVKFARIEQVVSSHQSMLENHQRFTEAGMDRLEEQILANREAANVREAGLQERLDELFAWRNRAYGAIGFVVLMLTVFGRDLWEAGTHFLRRLWH